MTGDDDLMVFLRAIATRDASNASRLLAKSPRLAQRALEVGASRETPTPYFLEAIAHYVYAGDTALHLAAAAYLPALAKDLIARGADPTVRNRRGAEPLHYAADGGPGSAHWDPDAQAAIVELLVQAGANPNAQDSSGVAPLHRAVRTRCTGAVRALLTSGAEPTGKNKSGSTPLHLAVQNTGRSDSGSVAAQAEQREIIELLLKHGARGSDRNSAGRSVKDSTQAAWILALLI